MNIKDIVNRDIVNLTNCEQEPIHIPGSIQPHGFLIGVAAGSWVIDFCSGNTEQYMGLPHTALLGRSFEALFGATTTKTLQDYVAHSGLSLATVPYVLEHAGRQFLCTVHRSGDVYVIEAEPDDGQLVSMPSVYEQTRQFFEYIEYSATLQELCDAVARGTRRITGYDRVMVYRFDQDYNGEVFAESRRDDLEPFLGLHYPHTDIPAQARELYLRNLSRIIVDMDYTPVPLYTVDDREHKNLDLSLSVLRSVSPIHVEYLKNMGVGATLTISLVHNNKLWGLIACHHYTAKNITPPIRIAAQLQGHFLTSQIDIRQASEEYEVARRSNEVLERFLSRQLDNTDQSLKDIVNDPQILEICNATGVCVLVQDVLYCGGVSPAEAESRSLIAQLSRQTGRTYLETSFLSSVVPEAAAFSDVAAGVIYHALSIVSDDCIIWFRPETIKEVNWGGDPNKAIVKNEQGLHPRNSFNLWKEIVKDKSKPWLQPELNAAANYSHALQKHVAMLALSREEEKYRTLSEILRQSNEELENINWVSTHDLQEPLRKIQIMASRVLDFDEEPVPAKVTDHVMRMNNSARRMQLLLRDILNYGKIRHAERMPEPVDVNKLLNEVIADFEENIKEKNATIRVSPLPQIHGTGFLIKQLFANLVNNSLKFSATDHPQTITIEGSSSPMPYPQHTGNEQLYHEIVFSDTGIGFEPKFEESIFKMFTRLHLQTEYQGSGVGLALCKKIMQAHDGYIRAAGKPGAGASFYLYFPV